MWPHCTESRFVCLFEPAPRYVTAGCRRKRQLVASDFYIAYALLTGVHT